MQKEIAKYIKENQVAIRVAKDVAKESEFQGYNLLRCIFYTLDTSLQRILHLYKHHENIYS